jgi:hypothetical protein
VNGHDLERLPQTRAHKKRAAEAALEFVTTPIIGLAPLLKDQTVF